jgi:hypothetical protein
MLDNMVMSALDSFGGVTKSAKDIRQHISQLFHLDYEESEIDAAAQRLGHKELIKFEEHERNEAPTFAMLPATSQLLANNLQAAKQMEDSALDGWKSAISAKYSKYPPVMENLERLVENLKLFTVRMLSRHGMECAALLYPEVAKTRAWLQGIGPSIMDELPRIDAVTDAVAKLEIPSFFLDPNPQRATYLGNLFNSSFMWHLAQVDEKCSRLLREVTKGQKLVLDNNILYSLVGLHGPRMLRAVDGILKLAKTLGYELWVSTKTLDEFRSSLSWSMSEAKRRLPVPAELARVALDNLGVDSFITNYWQELVQKGISLEEFVAEKSQIEFVLYGLDVETTDEFRKEIEGSAELQSEMQILRSCCPDTNELVIEHDAFHRILISKMRKEPKYNFASAVAWFLTHDHSLPAYDRKARKGSSCIPFCITTDQWVQLNRPLLVRAANGGEYEEAFRVVVVQPFVRALISASSMEKAYVEVLSRLAKYDAMNPELVLHVVADRQFMVAMALESDETRVEQAVDRKIVDLAAELRDAQAALKKSVAEKEQKIGALTTQIELLQTEVRVTNEKVDGELKRQCKEFTGEIELLKKTQSEETQVKDSTVRDLRRTNRVLVWLLFGLCLGLGSLFVWTWQLWLAWPWLAAAKGLLAVEIEAQFLVTLLCLNIPLRSRKWLLGLCVAIVLAMVACAFFPSGRP